MKYLSVQTFQCGISVSGAATFTGGATINLLALNGATTSSEASLFLGAHGTNEGGQLVLQKGTSNTYAAHLDNYADQFRILYGTNTGSTGVALAVSLSTRQLILPAYTSTSSFSGTAVGYLAFDSAGNVITVPSPAGAVTSIIAGTGVSVSSATGNVTISIGQSVATSAQVTFDSVITNNNGNGTNLKIGDDAWIGDVNAANTFRVTGAQNGANGYIIFGNANFDALGRSGTGNLTYAGSTVWTAATLTDLSQLTNGPGYITSAALSGYVPTSRTLTINGTSYDLSANRTWTINTVDYTSRLQHQVKAGVAINKGQAVYVTTADGTNMIVGLASNASEATSSKTMGLLDATVTTNGFANVVTEGLLAGLDTSTAGTEGDPVWLGTGGNLIYGLANKPSAPAHLVFIGIVTRKNNSNGEIFVKVQNGFELNEIHDVDLITTVPVNGHILGYNGTLWVNKTIAGWLGYTPANASGTTNYISKFTGSTTLGNSQIFDNGTNVGIGTTNPLGKLHIADDGPNALRIGDTQVSTIGETNDGGYPGMKIVPYNSNIHIGISSTNDNKINLWYAGNNYTYWQQTSVYSVISNYSTNALVFQVNGGNVGIGTTTPYEKLEVNGAISATGAVNGTSAQGHSTTLAVQSGTSFLYAVDWGAEFKPISVQAKTISLETGTGSTTSRLFIDNSGNVGIGNTSPTSILDASVSSGATSGFRFKGWSDASTPYLLSLGTQTYQDIFQIKSVNGLVTMGIVGAVGSTPDLAFQTNSTERMRITSGGNVGIGTASSVSKLHVLLNGNTSGGPTGNVASFQNSSVGNNAYITLFGSYNAESGIVFTDESEQYKGKIGYNNNTEHMYFQTDGSERMRITSGGQLIVGGTTVGYAGTKLQVGNTSDSQNGLNILTSTTGYGYILFGDGAGADTYVGQIWYYHADNYMGFQTNGSEKMRINSSGNLGIGTTNPGFKLDVNGAARVNQGSVPGSGQALIVAGSGDIQLTDGGSVFWGEYSYAGSTYIRAYDDGNIMYFYLNGTNMAYFRNDRAYFNANVGIGTTSPSQLLHVAGNIRVTGAFYDSNNQAGTSGQILKSTGTGTDWVSLSEITGVDGSGTANYVAKWSDADTVTNSLIYDNGTNVGIGTTSPGYNFDVNGQVRVQDKLRVGTVNSGNGVVHMSSSATINPNTTTIVWAQNVSVGMCAFIEYYILNNNSLTDQRAGTIIVTWNQSGTPTIAHTETTTPDIGSTTSINFTSSLVGSDARINAVNSSANPYTIVMSYKYF